MKKIGTLSFLDSSYGSWYWMASRRVYLSTTENYAGYVGLIKAGDYTSNSSWLTYQQYTLTASDNNKVKAVSSSGLVDSDIDVSKVTHPVVYLKENVLIVGGTGTSSDPYILELSGNNSIYKSLWIKFTIDLRNGRGTVSNNLIPSTEAKFYNNN